MAYLTVAGFKDFSLMPSALVDELEEIAAGFLDQQLESESRRIDSRLRKRYAVPFEAPVPVAVQGWLARIVTVRAFLKRGVDPTDAQFTEIKADADAAIAELKEAADSNEGLFDLPVRADSTATGISRGGPFGYSEASPYVWTDLQVATGRDEDRDGSGTHG